MGSFSALVVVSALLAIPSALAMAQTSAPSVLLRASMDIDTAAPTVVYSPMIFGGFLEHFDHQVYGGIIDPGNPLSDQRGFRRDALAALKELRVPIVRWPGGCFVSGYHWELGVGKARKPTDDMAWGVIEPNTFGTDEYLDLCREMGWTPYICNNAGNGTIREMRNWVEYCNAKTGKYAEMRRASGFAEPRAVPIWSVGNENYHPTEIGHKPAEVWAPFVAEAAKTMKQADPTIKLTAAATSRREWTLPLLKTAGQYLDYISIHSYWLHLWNRNEMPDYLTCVMLSDGPEQEIRKVQQLLDESGYRGKIKIAYDEWNLRSWHHPEFPRTTIQDYNDPTVQELVKVREENDIASQYAMADALFTASFFNACLRNAKDVGMAKIAPIVNTRGPLFVYHDGIVKHTHFHAMAMYANELQPNVADARMTSDSLRHLDRTISVCDGIATTDDSKQHWAIALVNRHPSASIEVTLRLSGKPLDDMHEATLLSADSADAFNDVEHPDRVAPRKIATSFKDGVTTVPAHSLLIVKLDRTSAPSAR